MKSLDKKSSSVRQLIIKVSDQLKAGEISLIETTPEEAESEKPVLIPTAKSAECVTAERNTPIKPPLEKHLILLQA